MPATVRTVPAGARRIATLAIADQGKLLVATRRNQGSGKQGPVGLSGWCFSTVGVVAVEVGEEALRRGGDLVLIEAGFRFGIWKYSSRGRRAH
jgi:hypothetical protein